jgi:hypothetical protein
LNATKKEGESACENCLEMRQSKSENEPTSDRARVSQLGRGYLFGQIDSRATLRLLVCLD